MVALLFGNGRAEVVVPVPSNGGPLAATLDFQVELREIAAMQMRPR